MNITPNRLNNHARAFSLIETALAVALVSFTLVVVFGILPAGLATLSDAGLGSTRSEMIRKVAAELRGTSFDELDAFISGERFPITCDVNGIEVTPDNAVFWIRCAAEPVESQPTVRVVRILIGLRKDPDPSAPMPQQSVEQYPVTLADWGI